MSYHQKLGQPQAAPLPSHLTKSICPNGRFLAYVEDEPFGWSRSFQDKHAAVDAMRWFVSQRLTLNGAGCGAVLDDETGLVVSVDEMPMPVGAEMPEVVEFIRAQCRRLRK